MFKFFLILLLLFLSSFAFSAPLYRGDAELLNSKAYAFKASSTFFTREGSYDVDGLQLEQIDGTEYKLIDADLALSYGINKNLELTIFGRFRNASSTVNNVLTKKSGPESLGVELKYGFAAKGNFHSAVGVHYRQTLYSNAIFNSTQEIPTEELVLGDSGGEYGVDLYGTYLMGALKWSGNLGYNSPANNLSEEIIYKLEAIYQFKNLGLLAGIEGSSSLKKDTYTETPGLKPIQATGASNLFNSINREKLAPFLGANYAFDKILLGIKGEKVISGKSTDKGSSITASLSWNTMGISPESVKINSFKEYQIDGSVLKVSARGNFLRIDQGLSTDVEKGGKFDIYQTDYFGGNVLVASGVVFEVGADWSIIKILKKYSDIKIKPGFAARGY